MRPVRRGASPQTSDFREYADAKPFLISRLGSYCSYCERRISTQLAVEHIQPKGLRKYARLIRRWENFLLACVNCNSTKGERDVLLKEVLLPDRDNTFIAYTYSPDGTVVVSTALRGAARRRKASQTLSLVGLNKAIFQVLDENGKMVAIDRVSQRMQSWLLAQDAKVDVDANPSNNSVRSLAIRLATQSGFFSIWMIVFDGDVDMQRRLVEAFEGTQQSGCFDATTLQPVSPAPNPDRLARGGKV